MKLDNLIGRSNEPRFLLGPDGNVISLVAPNGEVSRDNSRFESEAKVTDILPKGRDVSKVLVDGSKYRVVPYKNGSLFVLEPKVPKHIVRKALSTGLISSMLWLYAGGRQLFGKEDDKDKETYEKVLVQTLPKPKIDINEIYNNLPKNLESRLDDSYQKTGNQGFRYDLKTNKLIPVKEYNQENNSKDDKESEKKEKKGISPLAIAGIAAAIVGGGAALYFLTKKKNNVHPPPPPPPDKPDLTVICYDLNGNRVNNATIVIDGNTYNTTNGQYTLKDITKGNHSVDFTGDVLDTWLIVRDSLNGSNIEQKDLVDRVADVNVTSDKTLYLVKIPSGWDINKIGVYLERPLIPGIMKFTNSVVPVIITNEYGGDITEALRVLDSNLTQMNESQKRGEFTSVRHEFKRQDSASNPKIDIYFKDIWPHQSTHGEDFLGFKITYAIIELPGEKNMYSKTLEELFGGITHIELDEEYLDLLNGEEYNELAKKVMMLYAHFKEGTMFLSSDSSAIASSAQVKNSINRNQQKQNESRTLNLNQRIGRGNLRARMSGYGRDISLGIGADIDLKNGALFGDYDLTNRVLLAGIEQRLLDNAVNLKLNYRGSSFNKQLAFEGGFKPTNNTYINLLVNNLLDPKNSLFLNAGLNSKYVDASVAVNKDNILVQANVDTGDVGAFISQVYRTFDGSKATNLGLSYRIGNTQFIARGNMLNTAMTDMDLGIQGQRIADSFSLAYGIAAGINNLTKEKKVSITFSLQFQ